MASLGRRLTNIADLLTTKGGLIAGNGTSWAALPVGTDTQLLEEGPLETLGLKWVDAPVSAAYAAAVIADSPVFYWKMNEASGAPQDSSGNGNHAILLAANWNYQVAGPIAEEGQYAMEATHTASLMYITHTGLFTSAGPASFEIWAKNTLGQRTASTNIFGCLSQAGPAANQHWELLTHNVGLNSYIYVGIRDGAGTFRTALGTTTPINDGAWHHIVGTIGSVGGLRLYMDGALEASSAGGTNTIRANTSVAYTVNNLQSGTAVRAWVEPVAHAAFYDSELTAAQVAAHYAAAGV